MAKIITVVIPYFQRDSGILARALNSITSQKIPDGWFIEIIVVDDDSPCAARYEVEGIIFADPVRLKVVWQENGGVASARNRGIDEADPATILIAFLDSDDSWPQHHIAIAIDAFERGYEFIFSDNRRDPHHDSYLEECGHRSLVVIQQGENVEGLIEVPQSEMASLIIEEFPAQASTVVYQLAVDPDLRFNTDLAACGEDVLFMVALTTKAKKICFNARTRVECGRGVNVFFGHFEWDSSSFMAIKLDQVRCHTLISKLPNISRHTLSYNASRLRKLRYDFVFHTIRRTLKSKGKLPNEFLGLAKIDHSLRLWFPLSLLSIVVKYPLGFYKP
jgi:succinoglycan biosynthesis protein ExoW